MRPDRVIVGEARGSELVLLLQAMNNGHRGSGATIHVDRFDQIPNRLIVLGLLAGISAELTSQLALGAIDWVIQLDKSPRRHISSLGKLEMNQGELSVREVAMAEDAGAVAA
jgi:pilus assembly protein CpaF